MKRVIIALLVIMIHHIADAQYNPSCYYTQHPAFSTYICEEYDDWVVVFEDNFDGSTLNTDLWTTEGSSGQSWYCEDDPSYNTLLGEGNNHVVSNGKLKLIARDDESGFYLIRPDKSPGNMLSCDGVPSIANQQWFEYTTGWIRSNQEFVYGKFEIRCEIPEIEDLWPAFWLFGDCGQEIDVFEFMSDYSSKKATFSYHGQFDCDGNTRLCNDVDILSEDMNEEMHTYSVEWDEHLLIWRVDGSEVMRKSRFYRSNGQEAKLCGSIAEILYKDRIFPRDDIPMQVIANLRVNDDSGANFPVDLEIEYIRIYQSINSNSVVNICSKSDILGSTVAGQEIVVGGASCSSITIEDEEILDLVAKDKIELTSALVIESGARFSMKIDN